MSYSIYRISLAIGAAALVAFFFTIITATADQVEDSAQADLIGDGQCTQRAWPFYETHCLRDLRPQSELPKSVRVVTTER